MGFVINEHPVSALGPDGPYPPFRLAIRPRRSRRAVTPRMCTRRVVTSMTNSTYRRLRKTVSTVKKSHASKPSAWARKNVRQEVSRSRGAGR